MYKTDIFVIVIKNNFEKTIKVKKVVRLRTNYLSYLIAFDQQVYREIEQIAITLKATSHSTIFDIPMRLLREDQRHRRRFTS